MAFQVQPGLLASWAVGERNVVVSNVVEEVDLLLRKHQTGCDRMNWCVTPALVEESTIPVKVVEVVNVSLGTKPVKVSNLEVGPLSQVLACVLMFS